MRAEYIQNCSSDSALLNYYAEKEYTWMNAGREIKKAIAALEFSAWLPFTMKTMNSIYFTVQRMKYNGILYAIVTNSAINYIFQIYNN